MRDGNIIYALWDGLVEDVASSRPRGLRPSTVRDYLHGQRGRLIRKLEPLRRIYVLPRPGEPTSTRERTEANIEFGTDFEELTFATELQAKADRPARKNFRGKRSYRGQGSNGPKRDGRVGGREGHRGGGKPGGRPGGKPGAGAGKRKSKRSKAPASR